MGGGQGLLCDGKPVLGEPGFLGRLEKIPRSRERQTNFRSAPWTVGTIGKLENSSMGLADLARQREAYAAATRLRCVKGHK